MKKLKTIFGKDSGTSFVGISTCTTVKLCKKLEDGSLNPMYEDIIHKTSEVHGMTYGDTNAYVNAAVKADPSFVPGVMRWGKIVGKTPLIENKGKHYLRLIVKKSKNIQYWCNGVEIAKTDIIGLRLSGKRDVSVCTYAEDSITEVRANGKVFN